ncbi:glutamine--tRNA ligase/YqeY domain fusion protein [Xylophilus sp. GOD-11R]|uniref:glutamine--tRNA ligase/YqeY domain fusion protein n=1 Tax=Xylophilus sp. GOD-11R TaxID=3089814 RepID=UPI00298C96E5|nr:glutamine--tRNA ligase/YqeY domain fusion protein [Xylophilus sp. GOD-11R]WPB59291.1 glutamine--tRNA ligase/YqeY domain fusion protein [Xylophilus sp. GOD-11R]
MNSPALATHAGTGAAEPVKPSNFLRHVVESDLSQGRYVGRHWGGSPGDAAHHAAGIADPARVRLRFPPEPNGYLHVGHAKSIWLNFSMAAEYGGVCHLRFDDTNPEKEDQEYVDSIRDTVRWLGYDTMLADDPAAPGQSREHEYFASDYFDLMYRAAEMLVEAGHAYVDEQTPEQMRANRGDFTTPGTDSPFRSRSPAENLARLREMRDGQHADGSMVLRAKIDMASPNINLRDPAIYRIRRATHHNTGDRWCIYPMYTFAHPIEDALEQITHSICTLEFEDQRPFYDWLLERLAEGGLLASPQPRQYEFARLNVTYMVTSKRKLKQLVDEKYVDGWDDPRMPTLAGLRRRGYTPAALRLFCERSGVTKVGGWTEYSALEAALRETLDPVAARAMAVLEPVRLVLTNWDGLMGEGFLDACQAPVHPHHPEQGVRHFQFGRDLWIERTDYEDTPPKGYNRLFPGNKVRLKYGHVIECTGAERDADGKLVAVLARLLPDTKSGTPGADAVKVKGVITWVSVADAVPADFNLYDRLFTQPHPDAGDNDFLANLNPASLSRSAGFVEPGTAERARAGALQFERHGYFTADRAAGAPVVEAPLVFNRTSSLRDNWTR